MLGQSGTNVDIEDDSVICSYSEFQLTDIEPLTIYSVSEK